ncbi:MAG TPA: glutathione S-transferase family protein [Acidocella sp.]|jgi:glutathione S-transferase|nr:glutathione S-transferase family protein [Acidocella sp.]
MTRLLYDLAGADPDLRFSPFCWRTKLALAHKNLDYETVPWRFTDQDAIAFSGQNKVPVLVDGGQVVSDSQDIADYLEETYAHEPPLYGEAPARALTGFVKAWAETVLQPALMRVLAPDIFARLDERDQDYFRTTREARLGCTLEELAARREEFVAAFQAALAPLLALLNEQDFLSGDAPGYADHIVFGALQWAKLMSSTPLIAEDSLISVWMAAVLETYGLE